MAAMFVYVDIGNGTVSSVLIGVVCATGTIILATRDSDKFDSIKFDWHWRIDFSMWRYDYVFGDLSGKLSDWRWEYREKFRNFVSWAVPDPKTAFLRFLGYPSIIQQSPAHSLQETVLPKPMVPMESRHSEGTCLLRVYRACDQAFGRYRSLRGAEK